MVRSFNLSFSCTEIPRILIATEICKEMIAYGNCEPIEEIVKDSYRFADEILKQGINQDKWGETDWIKYWNN